MNNLLGNDNSNLLRAGLKVEVYIINSVNDNTLRIANRSYYTGEGEYDL